MVVDELFNRSNCLCCDIAFHCLKDSQRHSTKVMSNEDKISRDELIVNLEQFQDDLKDSISNKSTQLKALIGGASSLAMISSFLLGRKSGKKTKPGSNSETAE